MAEGERGVSEGVSFYNGTSERQCATRLKRTNAFQSTKTSQVTPSKGNKKKSQVDAARHRGQNKIMARQPAKTQTDLAKTQAGVEIHRDEEQGLVAETGRAADRTDDDAWKDNRIANKRYNNLLKKIEAHK